MRAEKPLPGKPGTCAESSAEQRQKTTVRWIVCLSAHPYQIVISSNNFRIYPLLTKMW